MPLATRLLQLAALGLLPGHCQEAMVMFGSNHKSGTVLSQKAAKLVCTALGGPECTKLAHPKSDGTGHCCNVTQSPHFDGTLAPGPLAWRVVNFARRPRSQVASGYLYHLAAPRGERWAHRPLSEGFDSKHPAGEDGRLAVAYAAEDAAHSLPPFAPGESFVDYLNRVPERDGVAAEMVRGSASDLPNILSAAGAPDVLTVCLESFMGPPELAADAWRAVLAHSGVAADVGGGRLLGKLTALGGRAEGHGTEHGTDKRARVSATAGELDADVFGGSVLAELERVLGCG